MAVKKVIELEVDLKKAQDDIRDIREQFTELQQSVKGVEKEGKKTNKSLKKGFKNLQQALVNLQKKGINKLKDGLKALPVLIVVEAFNTFKSVLSENQRLVDASAIAYGALSNVFNDFVNFILDNVGGVVEAFKGIFEDPLGAIQDFSKAVKENLIERFESYIETLGLLGSAVKKVFSGDFAGAFEDVKSAGKEAVDVLTGVDDSFDKVAETLPKLVDKTKEYIKTTIDSAAAEVNLANAAQIAAAEQEKLRLINLKAAQDQKKIRDDVSADIDARIEANRKLGKILEDGIKQELVLAQVQADAAAAALANNSTKTELIAEDIRAQAQLLEIQERLGGQQEEQLVQEVGLLREKLDLQNTISTANSEAITRELEGQLAIEDGILDRLALEKQVAAEQQRIAEEQFENTKAIFGEGTKEFAEAEKNKLAAQETFANISKKLKKQEEEEKLAIVSGALQGIQSLLGETSVAGKAAAVASSIINTYQGATKALAQGGIFGAISAAGVIASGLASVKKIVATKIPNANDSVGTGSVENTATPVAQAPAFNIVGQSPINQITDALNKPQRAYVVSGDVTTAQQLDRNIINESGI